MKCCLTHWVPSFIAMLYVGLPLTVSSQHFTPYDSLSNTVEFGITPSLLASGNFDNSAVPGSELFVVNPGGQLSFLTINTAYNSYGEHTGFTENVTYMEVGHSYDSTIDIFGNPIPDLLCCSAQDNRIEVFSHEADYCSFHVSVVSDQLASPSIARGIDIYGDDTQEIVVVAEEATTLRFMEPADEVWWMPWTDGTADEALLFTSDNGPITSLQYADLDGDGDQDLVLATDGDGGYLLVNEGNLVFTPQSIAGLPENLEALYVCDTDNDQDLDLVFHATEDHLLGWLENEGAGVFSSTATSIYTGSSVFDLEMIDANNDGAMDVLFAENTPPRVSLALNDGTGSSWTFSQIMAHHTPLDVVVGDWDGNGKDELAISTTDATEKLIIYLNTAPEGCLEPGACNYDPSALYENGTCCYGACGCTHPPATNYVPEADCNDGSCMYLERITVFNDENGNGDWDSGELPLPNYPVTHVDEALTLFTGTTGTLEYPLGIGDHTFSYSPSETFPFTTTDSVHVQTLPMDVYKDVELGVSTSEPVYSGDAQLFATGARLCNAFRRHVITYQNESSVTVDAVVALEYDSLFQDHAPISDIDSTSTHTLYFSAENIAPGQVHYWYFELKTPSVDWIGTPLHSQTTVWAWRNGTTVYSTQVELHDEVSCAYDPNDKQVFPQGYTDAHLVLEQPLDYLIRFQNTGNAPAQTVTIRDTLDAGFDLSTFTVESHSHHVQTFLDLTSREVAFVFEDIQLPDSTCCEEDSHGFISYSVAPQASLGQGDVLENTAFIFFDNNPPIVTNTTWSTIHACADALSIDVEEGTGCPLNWVNLSSDYDTSIPWEYDVSWSLDTQVFSEVLDTPLYPPAENALLTLTVSNPLCTESAEIPLDLGPKLWATCPGDLNCDGLIDTQDLLAVLGELNCVGQVCAFDVDEDGETNVGDVLAVLGAFASTCE